MGQVGVQRELQVDRRIRGEKGKERRREEEDK
jgi:hypothetical protein